jgi:hypothetical protein
MTTEQQNLISIADSPGQDAVRRAAQAIGLIVLVALFNIGLCAGIFWLVKQQLLGGLFPAFVLFLSFALSVGVILIIVLGEKINSTNIENEWIKRIGVTPIMVIVAVLISILAGFSPLAEKIIEPSDPYSSQFMLAKIGVTCATQAKGDTPQARDLLVVISSEEKDYIKSIKEKIKEFRSDPKLLNSWMRTDDHLDVQIVGVDPKDETYNLLSAYKSGSESLTQDMNKEENWVAYRIPVNAPNIDTVVPVPTIFDKSHRTRLFVVTNQLTPNNKPETSSLISAVSPGPTATKLKLTPLFQAGIVPRKPMHESYLTELGFRLYTDSACWHAGV